MLKKLFSKLSIPAFAGSKIINSWANLLLTAAVFISGILIFQAGYTYEGHMFFLFLAPSIFGWPYYTRIFTYKMTLLIIGLLLPVSIWLQNKNVEVGTWYYPLENKYLSGWITQTGQGPFNFTQIFWLGNDMPLMEYFFYPIFCIFSMTLYCFFSYILPNKPFEQVSKYFRFLHYFVFLLAGFTFLIPVLFDYHIENINYGYLFPALAQIVIPIIYFSNISYRKWLCSPAAFIWLILIGFIYLPIWEYLASLVWHDWIYDISKTTPAGYCFHGYCIPLYEVVGYPTAALTFPALLFKMIQLFGKEVIKDYSFFPFAKPQVIEKNTTHR